MKSKAIRVLMIEQSEEDALHIVRELKKGGYKPVYERIKTVAAMKKALKNKKWDILLCEYKMPNFTVPSAITSLKEENIDIPVIVVTGAVGDKTAADCMRLGVKDYIMKGNLSRLCPAIGRELEDMEIREKKRLAEEELLASEEKYRLIFENAPLGLLSFNEKGVIIACNDNFVKIFGSSREKLIGLNMLNLPDKNIVSAVRRALKGSPGFYEGEYSSVTAKKITPVRCLYAPMDDGGGRIPGGVGIIEDITEQKRAEEAQQKGEERYRSVVENAQEGIFQTTPEGKFKMANQAMATILGYDSPGELMKSVTDITRQIYVDPQNRSRIMETLDLHNIIRKGEFQFYRKDGSVIWASLKMQSVQDKDGKVLYYEGIFEDITNRINSMEKIKKAFGGTVKALASLAESRDSYTAGHQCRVAELAAAIAKEIRLFPEQIEGLNMAGIIHDIGKVSVPADILNKPRKLTVIEFDLVKTHVQSGYDIVKDIEFPWPVARMILEHHERINGSGYPNGLTGDDLLLESRIMAVADVVEAMASHRPYRAALGIDAALEEIAGKRGIIYDSVVVDACLRLFREQGYSLKSHTKVLHDEPIEKEVGE
jgi:PAS domain S-box-containing protein/putative nucleotidyltransferase with HDIG domain